ncbi:MAG: hypothetical protein MUC96_06950 [Myxococcaceae bacterium]|nr:hypothetical protein [Myxococcaceae bacterium]
MTLDLVAALVLAMPLAPCGATGVDVTVRGLPATAVAAFVEDLRAEALPPGLEPCVGPSVDQLTVDVGGEAATLRARVGGDQLERTVAFRAGDEPVLLAMLAGELLRALAARPRRTEPVVVAPLPREAAAIVTVGASATSMLSLAGDGFFGPELFVSLRHRRWGLDGSAGAQWAPPRAATSGAVWSLAVLASLRASRVVLELGAFTLDVQAGVRGGALRGASLVVVAWEPVFAFEAGTGAGLDVGPVRLVGSALLGVTARGVRWLDGGTPTGGLSGLMATIGLGAGWRW